MPVVRDDRMAVNPAFMQWLAFGFPFDTAQGQQEVERLDAAMADWRATDRGTWARSTPDEQDALLAALLDAVLRGVLQEAPPGARLVVGLSGGHDSRAVGAAWPADVVGPVRGATYGRPGSVDFEVVRRVTPGLGVTVRYFDVRHLAWDRDLLLGELSGQLDRHLSPRAVAWPQLERQEGHVALVHGFMNGPLTGQRYSRDSRDSRETSWDVATREFSAACDPFSFQSALDRRAVRALLPERPWPGAVPYSVQLQGLIQRQRIRPLSTPRRTMLLPFDDPRWVGFWLNRSGAELGGQARWLQFLRRRHAAWFPELTDWDGREPAKRLLRRWAVAGASPLEPGDLGPVRIAAEQCWRTSYRDNPTFRTLVDDSIARLRSRRVLHERFVHSRLTEWRRGTKSGAKSVRGLVATEFALACGLFD